MSRSNQEISAENVAEDLNNLSLKHNIAEIEITISNATTRNLSLLENSTENQQTFKYDVIDFGFCIWTIWAWILTKQTSKWSKSAIKEKLQWHYQNVGKIYKKGSITLSREYKDCTFIRFGANRKRRFFSMDYEHVFIVPRNLEKLFFKRFVPRLIPQLSYSKFRSINKKEIGEMECFFPASQTRPQIYQYDLYKFHNRYTLERDREESLVFVYECLE